MWRSGKTYHEIGQTAFEYGDWLSFFICSVNWRTLHLDNIVFHAENKWRGEVLDILDTAEQTLADFLLGNRNDIADMENHILPMFEITDKNTDIKEPNFLFRVSAFDYTFFLPSQNAYYVCANLAGVLIFTVVRRGDNDVWDNTFVNLIGGSIDQPPVHITSPLMRDIVELLNECSATKMSQKQVDRIIQTLKNNPEADQSKAMQYRKMDEIH